MNRRGFFGALLGGIAGAAGLHRLIGLPARRAMCWAAAPQDAVPDAVAGADIQTDRVVMLKTSAMGKSEFGVHFFKDAVDLPGTAPWRVPNAGRLAVLPKAYIPPAMHNAQPISVPPWAVGRDLPEVWPARAAEIIATAALPPLAQVDRLVELFGASGEAAPSFAAALIGELVLTRMRLAAADPRNLWGLEA